MVIQNYWYRFMEESMTYNVINRCEVWQKRNAWDMVVDCDYYTEGAYPVETAKCARYYEYAVLSFTLSAAIALFWIKTN